MKLNKISLSKKKKSWNLFSVVQLLLGVWPALKCRWRTNWNSTGKKWCLLRRNTHSEPAPHVVHTYTAIQLDKMDEAKKCRPTGARCRSLLRDTARIQQIQRRMPAANHWTENRTPVEGIRERTGRAWKGSRPLMNNNAKQPELPGTKPLPKDYTWTDPGLWPHR